MFSLIREALFSPEMFVALLGCVAAYLVLLTVGVL
jgi:hypothetical protein